MTLCLSLQYALTGPNNPWRNVPTAQLRRELRDRMRLAAFRWRLALTYNETGLAQDCLLNARRWRDMANEIPNT